MPSNPAGPSRDADSRTAPTQALRRQIADAVDASLADIRAELADLSARQRHMAELLENLTRAVTNANEDIPAAPEEQEETELALWPTGTAGPKGTHKPENHRPKERPAPATAPPSSAVTESRPTQPEEEELPLDLPLSTWPLATDPPPPPAPETKPKAAAGSKATPAKPAPNRQGNEASPSNEAVVPKETAAPFRPAEAVGETAADWPEEEPYREPVDPSTAPLFFPARNGRWGAWQAHPYLRGLGLVAAGLILLAGVLWSISRPLSTDPVNPTRSAETFRPVEPSPGMPRQGGTVPPQPPANKGIAPLSHRLAPGMEKSAAGMGKPQTPGDEPADAPLSETVAPRGPAPDPMPAETAFDASPHSPNPTVGESPKPLPLETSNSAASDSVTDATDPADASAMPVASSPESEKAPLRPPPVLSSGEIAETASAKTEKGDAAPQPRTEPVFSETTNEDGVKTPSVAPAPTPRPFTILLATLQSRRQVRLAQTEYEQMGMAPFWTEVDLEEKGIWYRVFWGHFETEAAARQKKQAAGLAAAMVKRARWTAAVGTAEANEADRLLHRVTAQTPWMGYTMAAEGNRQRVCVGAFYTEEGARLQCRKLRDQGMDCTVERR